MNYLTQAFLDYEVAARRRLRDLYDWHQLVWEAFRLLRRICGRKCDCGESVSVGR